MRPTGDGGVVRDPEESLAALYEDLGAGPGGLSAREAARRLVVHGPNELARRAGPGWPRAVGEQLVHPLALLLWAAAALSLAAGSPALAVAIVLVVLLNAAVALLQEHQAERAVEALQRYLPPLARAVRDGRVQAVEARLLVPGDVILVGEGDRVSADARLIDAGVEVDMSALTGESSPVYRSADAPGGAASLLEAHDLVLSGAVCTGGEARAIVVATGMGTELGRIAALSQRVGRERSPLEDKVRRVAWLIAIVAVGAGVLFLAAGVLAAGLPVDDALRFAIGLLVANVPEGLLPTITLALAVGVRGLARRGALVKRLSAVETLGSTTVVCTDKTGTLTENRMRPAAVWVGGRELGAGERGPAAGALARRVAACTTALPAAGAQPASGDATELALLETAASLGADIDPARRDARRLRAFRFDPALRLMSTVERDEGVVWISVKGAPEAVLPRCTLVADDAGGARPLDAAAAAAVGAAVTRHAGEGLRVLAVAARRVDGAEPPARRADAERDLTLLGLVAVADPPRAGVRAAVARCRAAGIRVIVVTGDNGLTAEAVARRVGIVDAGREAVVVTGAELDRMDEARLEELLRDAPAVIFARCSPEAKLRITDTLRGEGHVVAMTGDGVNDAPALRRADIGVAMGASGTDVAREAATMILTDDDFSTIVAAVEEGRRVYDNVRKFILYIFAHATPEVVPFLVFALSGGAVPLPLTVMQILAIDLGTETLPAVALGREPAEPDVMERRPRPRDEPVVDRALLVRAWLVLGAVSAALVMAGFLFVLLRAGWAPGDEVGEGSPLHDAYVQATTMTFLGIVACQVGTAFAARTERSSLRAAGMLSNRLLLWGIAFEAAFCVLLLVVPPLAGVFGLALPPGEALLLLVAFPPIVWGVDEARRARARRQATRSVTSSA